MVKVFSRTGDGTTWRLDPAADVADSISARAARLVAGWDKDDIAEFDTYDEVVWKTYHSMTYTFDRIYDEECGINLLVIVPKIERKTKVWVSDHPYSFIETMRNAVADLLIENETRSGQRFFVRPGIPKKARLYRVPLYAGRVTIPAPHQ